MKHTPGPWVAQAIKGHNNTLVYKRIVANGEPIAFAGVYKGHNAEANAEFIVRACNSHYDLLESCKLASDFITHLPEYIEATHSVTVINLAIAKAEGK